MPFCPNCGTRTDTTDKYCGTCGKGLRETVAGTAYPSVAVASRTLPYAISVRRVLIMSALSYGLYLFYWFYLTWKQYREHTRAEAFPVGHALALMVPIYNLFRLHAHMRSFKELMQNAGLATTINAGWAVMLVLISNALGVVAFRLAGGFSGAEDLTLKTAVAIEALNFISIAVVAGVLIQVQGNLNRYWSNVANAQLVHARIGVGEVAFGLIGGIFWLNTLAALG
ncbi:MAG: zinc ribbon domain-containing protein [Dehalococcoidia bacterium]|jgi:hypothetical protein|nr:zinc ribbon domain-containing protein [Dehalococcoidia bacterium]MDP7084061.1 zinc ribbon domain-containing protein [Dehalococcoidia bacterium]